MVKIVRKQRPQTPPCPHSVPRARRSRARFSSNSNSCESCILAKQTLMHHRTPSKPTSETLELIHLDVNGPWNTPSLPRSQAGEINPIPAGSIYSLVLVDDFKGMSWVYFYVAKDQSHGRFAEFKPVVETQTARRIKRVRSDQAKEFHSVRMTTFMKESRIIFETSAIYAHEQNGKAERMNRTISDMPRTLMIEACLPETIWGEAFQTACYIRNRMVLRSSLNTPTTPHEVFYGEKPNLEYIRPFGCLAYVTRPHELRQKLITQTAAYKSIFLGYTESTHQYRVWNIQSGYIRLVRDVTFNENGFPAANAFSMIFPYKPLLLAL